MADLLERDAPDVVAARRRPLRRRLVGPVATAVILAVVGLCWLATGPMRSAGRLQEMVGIRWVLTSVGHDGRTAPVARLGDHTLTLAPAGSAAVGVGCSNTVGDWSWSSTGFELEHLENDAVSCGYAPGTEPPPTDPLVQRGSEALYGRVSADLAGSTLTVESDGYTLTYTRG